ncbi:MAG: phage tail tip lysozyme, partial [Candidatus Aminicenantales bacterium]
MTLLDRQKEVAKYLEAGFKEYELPGISLKGAASFVGNFTQENLVNPVTTGKKDHGSDAMGQWRLDRLDGPRGLRGWCAAHGLDWATLRSQSAFTLWELYNDARYNNLAADLKAGKKKIATLTANICVQYERPSDEEYVKKYRNPQTGELESLLDRRIVAAQATYDAVMKERVSPTAKATGVGAGGTLIAI